MFFVNRFALFFFCLTLTACDGSSSDKIPAPKQLASSQETVNQESRTDEAVNENPSQSGVEPQEEPLLELEKQTGIKIFEETWTGDFDVIREQRIIRVLTVYGLGRYFLDGAEQKGITYEWFKMFEDFVNKKIGSKHLRIHVVFIPVARDQLIPGLINGRGDIAAAGLTITPERKKVIDFTNPISRTLAEVLVTGPQAPEINTIEDLAGHKIYVRESSSYRSSLDILNVKNLQQGLQEINIEDAPEQLEDEDILEMVNAGLLEWAVVDDYKARLWGDIFENLNTRNDITFRSGGRIGFGIRKDSPQLAGILNEFIKTHKQGTLKGNILINRYLRDFDWAENSLAADDYQRFQDVVDIFEKFGDQYGVDYLMVAAQGYQESRLDQKARSAAGAIGIMQLLPSTAADSNVGIPDIRTAESNIHAGVKYLDFIRNRYFSEPDMDRFNQTMFAFAAYNAGPARIRKMRDKAAKQGYDPNIWFDNVEIISAKETGRETVQYVANILKYYVAYSLTVRQQLEREKVRVDVGIN